MVCFRSPLTCSEDIKTNGNRRNPIAVGDFPPTFMWGEIEVYLV